ncbi:hypothetical protein CCACVL1_30022 [Corchorus capsularis]|uniref:Uncharacterized protein n=1 Tax=Corchorus capsularis TaxID=210143 RepID=A0A1R3FZ05_COCAP|nr:hypothetical protein CCACVL1_30022 [Corchorus capsularis]
MVATLTNESATSKSVYFAHCTSEKLAEKPEKLAGPLLADTHGVSAVGAFYELLSQSSLSFLHPEGNKPVAPVELCPILKTLYKILITSGGTVKIDTAGVNALEKRWCCKSLWHHKEEHNAIVGGALMHGNFVEGSQQDSQGKTCEILSD